MKQCCFLVDAVVERSQTVSEEDVNFFERVLVSSKTLNVSLQEHRVRVLGLAVLSVLERFRTARQLPTLW